MIRSLSFWRATVLVAVLLSHASSIFVHAGGDGQAVTDRTLDQVPTHASGGKITGRATTRDRLPKFLKAITRDVKEVTQVDCCERTCKDARVHDGVDHTLDNCPLTDIYRNRHFFEKTSVDQRQRLADLLAVVRSINRAQQSISVALYHQKGSRISLQSLTFAEFRRRGTLSLRPKRFRARQRRRTQP
jgi:hypothetical protein